MLVGRVKVYVTTQIKSNYNIMYKAAAEREKINGETHNNITPKY